MGTGDWLRGQTEHAIMAVRGKPVVTLTNQTTLLHAPVRAHSQKPVEFYDLVESLGSKPRDGPATDFWSASSFGVGSSNPTAGVPEA